MKILPEILLILGFLLSASGVYLGFGLDVALMYAGGFLVVLALLIRATGTEQ